MDYQSYKKKIPGIGTLLGGNKEGEKIVREALTRIAKDEDIVRLVNSSGWKKLTKEYREMINQLREYAWWLCEDANKHTAEIQKTKNFANAADIFINMAEEKMREQENALKELNKNQGRDR